MYNITDSGESAPVGGAILCHSPLSPSLTDHPLGSDDSTTFQKSSHSAIDPEQDLKKSSSIEKGLSTDTAGKNERHTPCLGWRTLLTLHNMTSVHLTLPHSTSLYLTPPHSTSLHLTPPHSTSLYLTLPHSTSLYLTLPHSTSLYLTLPHSTSLYFI